MAAGDPLTITAAVFSAKVDNEGSWKLTLEIPSSDSAKVAALTQHVRVAFDVQFTPQPQSVGNESEPRL